METDLIIVGSGPSGANAAKQAIADGLSVILLDFGNDEPELQDAIPPQPFSTLRRTDPDQRRYFLGEAFETEAARNDRLGSHFTAPRAYTTNDVSQLLPIESDTFFPVQSLALGGLGAAWGAGCQTYERFELERAGLPAAELRFYYDEVVRDIGVSGSRTDDTAQQVLETEFAQPPSLIDSNARSIMSAYNARRSQLHARGFRLGRDPLAMLTERLSKPGIERLPNPYSDMDFYGHANRSVYRPKYTIQELQLHPKFRYIPQVLVQQFRDEGEHVSVSFLDGRTRNRQTIAARKLILAAGCLNSARIVLRSREMYHARVPLLSSAMHYLPCVNLRMLGRAADDRRHSLGQLLAVYTPPHRTPEHVIAGFISYRSLMHYRIVRQMPLHPTLGLIVSRTLMTSLTMVGVHHPERSSASKWMELQRTATGDVLAANYLASAEEVREAALDIRGLIGCLLKLRCVPLALFSTAAGSSIHYAGTMPVRGTGVEGPLACDQNGKLAGDENVYVADSASWRYLPAKGPTLTLMANARRVSHAAALSVLRSR